MDRASSRIPSPARAVLALLLAGLAAALGRAALEIPADPPDLAAAVAGAVPGSGVRHPLTAVLLNFRGYDTLLEVTVLFLAGAAALALAPGPSPARAVRPPDPVLMGFLRMLAPAVAVTAGYVLYAGSFRPGGAFQAGAVLASLLVLLQLAGLARMPAGSRRLRATLAAGSLVFVVVGAASLAAEGEFLRYPPGWAGRCILLIESAAALSIAAVFGVLFDRLEAGPEEVA